MGVGFWCIDPSKSKSKDPNPCKKDHGLQFLTQLAKHTSTQPSYSGPPNLKSLGGVYTFIQPISTGHHNLLYNNLTKLVVSWGRISYRCGGF